MGSAGPSISQDEAAPGKRTLNATLGAGNALPPQLRAKFEQSLGGIL